MFIDEHGNPLALKQALIQANVMPACQDLDVISTGLTEVSRHQYLFRLLEFIPFHDLQQLSTSLDGVAILETVHDMVVPALVQVVVAEPGSLLSSEEQGQGQQDQQQEPISIAACLHAACTLAGLSINDAGVEACLRHDVPKAIVILMTRCLKGEDNYTSGILLLNTL